MAASFAGCEISHISSAVGLDTAVECDAVRDADGVAHLWIDKGRNEIQLLGLGVYLYVGFHPTEV